MEGKVIGLGGVFLKFNDPDKMREWYSEVLEITTNDYGILFQFNNPEKKPGYLQLGTFSSTTDYFGNANQQVMLNFRVANLEQLLLKLKDKGTAILDEMETYDYGKFVHISDPEGNRIELWEPVDNEFSQERSTIME